MARRCGRGAAGNIILLKGNGGILVFQIWSPAGISPPSLDADRFTSLLRGSRLSYSPWKPIGKLHDWFRLYGLARVKMFHDRLNWRVGLLPASAAFERPCRNRFPVRGRLAKHPGTRWTGRMPPRNRIQPAAVQLKGDAVNLIAFLRVCRRFTENISLPAVCHSRACRQATFH